MDTRRQQQGVRFVLGVVLILLFLLVYENLRWILINGRTSSNYSGVKHYIRPIAEYFKSRCANVQQVDKEENKNLWYYFSASFSGDELQQDVWERRAAAAAASKCTFGDLMTSSEDADSTRSRQSRSRSRCGPSGSNYSITVNLLSKSGLGNQMFQYATLYAAARRYNMRPLVGPDNALTQYFTLPTAKKVLIRKFLKYLPWPKRSLPFPSSTTASDVVLTGPGRGYLQNYNHFKDYSREIRNEFTFRNEIGRDTTAMFIEIMKYRYGGKLANDVKQNIRVGIHVRRGDYLTDKGIKHGYTVATASYLVKAMAYYRSKYRNVTFIVVSNDMAWCRDNLSKYPDVIFFTGDRSNDLYLMTMCDHMIITVGTFGWWAAFLAGGEVVTYKNYPRNGSELARKFNPDTFYPKSWIFIGD